MTAVVAGCLEGLDPVGLAELDTAAALQRRTERKYVIGLGRLEEVLVGLPDGVRALEIDGCRSFSYRSVYFDADGLPSFHATARKRPRRVKVRTRTYADSATCLVECKVRGADGDTHKHRRPHPADLAEHLGPSARFVAGWWPGSVGLLQPVLRTSYRRTTLLVPDGTRATLDLDLRWVTPAGARAGLADAVVVETKGTGHPTLVDRVLWQAGVRPTTISKFGTGMAAVHPALPANRWARTLRTWVANG